MALCAWTAVHLNIPEHGKAKTQTWRKLGWMIISILAPEWVRHITLSRTQRVLTNFKIVMIAFCEHLAAKRTGTILRKKFGQPELISLTEKIKGRLGLVELSQQDDLLEDAESVLGPPRYPWTHTHSLYATMGGFVVDTRTLDKSYLCNGVQRMTLTLEGLEFIATHAPDLLPDLPESEINDKSKANAFTKFITCGQTLWFGVQCLSRVGQGLSMSLLELNTAVHAICALALYTFFWWEKPLDIEEPTVCTHGDIHLLAAYMTVCDMFPFAFLSLIDMEEDVNTDPSANPEALFRHPRVAHISLRRSKDPRLSTRKCLVYQGFAFRTDKGHPTEKKAYENLTIEDFERLELASQAVKKYGLCSYNRLGQLEWGKRTMGLALRLRNRGKGDEIFGRTELLDLANSEHHLDHALGPFAIGFVLAGLFYGSIHLIVWNRPFRSGIDELLWKISSLTILFSGTPLVVGYCHDVLLKSFVERLPRQVQSAMVVSFQYFMLAFLLFYTLCRMFVIVECFLDVFHLPDSAFEVPRWSQYFPHIQR